MEDLGSIGFKILWSCATPLVAAVGFLLRKSMGRTVKDIDKLVETDKELRNDNKELHGRVTELLAQVERLQGRCDAVQEEKRNRRRDDPC